MTEFMQKTENSYLWPSRFESNPQSYGSKGARNFADAAHCVMLENEQYNIVSSTNLPSRKLESAVTMH